MIRLSAFADEISADLQEQIDVLHSEHIGFLDLRSVWGINVLDLDDQQLQRLKQELDAAGIGVAAIGSPIGKVPVDSPNNVLMSRFERAMQVAKFLQTPYIRIFSFYQHDSGLAELLPAARRNEVLEHLQAMLQLAEQENILLLHENEKDIYGDTIARCVDILRTLNNDHLQAAFDPANFIQCGEPPYPEAYQALKPWIRYVHVKDALQDGQVVAAGEGVTRWPDLLRHLRRDGYDGFLSLEPHLAASGRFQGFSGPALFKQASQALQTMLREMQWQYE